MAPADGGPNVLFQGLKADSVADAIRSVVAALAKDQLKKFLKPMKFPFPAIGLSKLGTAFEGKSVTLGTPKIALDAKSARVSLTGSIAVVSAAAKK